MRKMFIGIVLGNIIIDRIVVQDETNRIEMILGDSK